MNFKFLPLVLLTFFNVQSQWTSHYDEIEKLNYISIKSEPILNNLKPEFIIYRTNDSEITEFGIGIVNYGGYKGCGRTYPLIKFPDSEPFELELYENKNSVFFDLLDSSSDNSSGLIVSSFKIYKDLSQMSKFSLVNLKEEIIVINRFLKELVESEEVIIRFYNCPYTIEFEYSLENLLGYSNYESLFIKVLGDLDLLDSYIRKIDEEIILKEEKERQEKERQEKERQEKERQERERQERERIKKEIKIRDSLKIIEINNEIMELVEEFNKSLPKSLTIKDNQELTEYLDRINSTPKTIPQFKNCDNNEISCFKKTINDIIITEVVYTKELNEFYSRNLRGKFNYSFTINKKGLLEDLKVKVDFSPEISPTDEIVIDVVKEGLRVLSKIPTTLYPGTVEGDPVKIPWSHNFTFIPLNSYDL